MNQKNLANGLILSSAGNVITLHPGYVDDMPEVPFFATGSQIGEIATLDNSEIVQVTAISGDNLTCDRAQRGTVEQALGDGWVLGNGIYVEDLTAIRSYVDSAIAASWQAKYPVGSTIINFSDATNPADYMGFGTWALDAKGLALVGKADSGTFATIGATLGAETHTLTTTEMPSHSHNYGRAAAFGAESGDDGSMYTARGVTGQKTSSVYYADSWDSRLRIQNTGGGGAHNNIQPSKVVYVWRRTA